jgi:hypothetical protein
MLPPILSAFVQLAFGGEIDGTSRVPPDCFLHELEKLSTRNGERRWRSQDLKRLYTWDARHGEVEVFNARGMHLGAADAQTGETIKPARKGRTIDV